MANFKFFLTIIFIAIFINLTANFLFSEVYLSSNFFTKNRLKQILDFFSKNAMQKKINLIVGSSEFFVNLSTLRMNNQIQNQDQYFLISNPDFSSFKQSFFLGKLKPILSKNNIEIDSVIVPLSISSIGKLSKFSNAELKKTLLDLVSVSEIIQFSDLKQIDRLELIALKFLNFDNHQDFTEHLLAKLNKQLLGDNNFSNIWTSTLLIEYPFWDGNKFGTYNFNSSSNQYFKYLTGVLQFNISEHQSSIQYYESCCKVLTLQDSHNSLEMYLEHLKSLRNFAKEVVVVYIPESPLTLSQRKPEVKFYIENIKSKLSNLQGVRFLDLSYVEFNESDYLDALHLSYIGARKVEKELLNFRQ